MAKLCCIPLTEDPEVSLSFNCVSTCCASELRDHVKTRKVDKTDNDDKSSEINETRSCCCLKKRSSNTQAKLNARKDEERKKENE